MNAKRCGLLVVGATFACLAPSFEVRGDFCTSPLFRKAFLEGQEGPILDHSLPSPDFIALGNEVLPCLMEIAEKGGATLGITTCLGGEYGCEGWALTAIRMIGTPEAREYLIANLDQEKPRHLIRIAIREVGILRDPAERPDLRNLLDHPDAEVRAASILSLGAIGNVDDFDVMVRASVGLPDRLLRDAANAFQILGDTRAFEALKGRVAEIEAPDTRKLVERVFEDWRSRLAQEERVLLLLRSSEGKELHKAIQQSQGRTEATRSALLELLTHEDPRTRAESVVAIARMQKTADFDQLLETTLTLPEPYVVVAARGLEILNDPRAIAPLEKYAGSMRTAKRAEVMAVVDRMRRRAATNR